MQISSPLNPLPATLSSRPKARFCAAAERPPHFVSSGARSHTRNLVLLCLATLLALPASAQSLARPGWSGNGIAPEAWWQHAVFYRIDDTQLPTLAELPSIQAFGIDAVLLTPQSIQPAPPTASDNPDNPLDLDDFLFQCGRLHIHVLVPLDLAAPNADPNNTLALARSWLYRGAAGFVITGLDKLQPNSLPQTTSTDDHRIHLAPAPATPQILTDLRKLLTQFPGSHILIGPPSASRTPAFQLQIATLPPVANSAHLAMLNAQTNPTPLLSLEDHATLSLVDATRLLATSAPAILDSDATPPALLLHVFPPLTKLTAPPAPAKPAPPPPPSNVYGGFVPYVPKNTYADQQRKIAAAKAAEDAKAEAAIIDAATFPVQSDYQPVSDTPLGHTAFAYHLIQLHRANAALQHGTIRALDTGSATTFAWLATRGSAAPLIVVCNPTSAKVTLDLTHALRGVATSSEMLRTLLHTASTSGVTDPSAVPVGPQGVYAGILAHGYVYR